MHELCTPGDAAAKLAAAERILILTHVKPDGDAVGSALGMQKFLCDTGKQADAFFPAPLPQRYLWMTEGNAPLPSLSREQAAACDLVLVLDCASPLRIAGGDNLDWEFLQTLPLLNVDHHGGNTVEAGSNLVDSKAAAASLLAAEIAFASGRELSRGAATAWLLGLITDTGGFRFTNTDGRALRIAARLLDCGAELEKINNAVFFSKPRNQQEFEADLLQNHLKFAFDGKFVYAWLPEELFAAYHFDMRDGEGVIDLLRELEGAVIVALFYRRGDAFKVSLRSKDSRYPVGPMARALGGGGHDMAAGITLVLPDSGAVETLLCQEVGKLLDTGTPKDI